MQNKELEETIISLREGLADRDKKIKELEAELKHLQNYIDGTIKLNQDLIKENDELKTQLENIINEEGIEKNDNTG